MGGENILMLSVSCVYCTVISCHCSLSIFIYFVNTGRYVCIETFPVNDFSSSFPIRSFYLQSYYN